MLVCNQRHSCCSVANLTLFTVACSNVADFTAYSDAGTIFLDLTDFFVSI